MLFQFRFNFQTLQKELKVTSCNFLKVELQAVLDKLFFLLAEPPGTPMKRRRVEERGQRRPEFSAEIEGSRTFQAYSALLHYTRILFSVNYSVGKQFADFIAESAEDRAGLFPRILAFEQHLLDLVFKDYNINKKETRWMQSCGQRTVDEIVFRSVS